MPFEGWLCLKFYVQISGVHGVGKTSLIEALSKKHGWIAFKEDFKEMPPYPFGSTGYRGFINEIWILSYLISSRRLALDGIVLCDRGFEDALAYSRALLDDELFRIFRDVWGKLYEGYLYKPDIIILLYGDPLMVKHNVESRCRKTMLEWRENDLDYICKVQEAFLSLIKGDNVFLIEANSFDKVLAEAEDIILRFVKK